MGFWWNRYLVLLWNACGWPETPSLRVDVWNCSITRAAGFERARTPSGVALENASAEPSAKKARVESAVMQFYWLWSMHGPPQLVVGFLFKG